MALVQVRVSELVEDYSIYPRHAVDSTHITDLASAIQAGEFDGKRYPVIADEKSKRIVDGFHRKKAWQKVYGDEDPIWVELRSYANETELLKDAVRLNSAHGRRLDRQDRTRCALMLQERGVQETEIAVVLHTTPSVVQTIMTKVVIVKDNPADKGSVQPAKPVAYPRPGGETREITREQAQVMVSSSGHRTAQTVTQLTRELRSGLVDLETPDLREKLEDLRDAIEEVL